MDNLNLRNKLRKAILPACEECGGGGTISDYQVKINHFQEYSKCKTCKGKGYIEPLSFGCELKNEYGKHIYLGLNDEEDIGISIIQNIHPKDIEVVDCVQNDAGIEEYENLGKPLTLQKVLLALSKEYKIGLDAGNDYFTISEFQEVESEIYSSHYDDVEMVEIPLTLPPEQWSQELQDKIIELL